MKVLMTVPSFHVLGGVASHYMGLRPHWQGEVVYHTIGRRRHLPAVVTFLPDLVLFVWRLLFGGFDAVLLNSSFKSHPIRRDGLLLRLCSLFGIPTAVFFHGWNPAVYDAVKSNPTQFVKTFNRARFIYVLFSGFAENLKDLGVKSPIRLTTTKVGDEFVKDFDIENRDGVIEQILFLARADKAKGLDVTVKAFEIAKQRCPSLRLCVCGDGNALQSAKDYVQAHGISDVTFRGFVKGQEVIECFRDSQLYILPTTHGEGMATSILEAMALGLVVVTRPVGGVMDFFEQDKMGVLLESVDPEDYAEAIIRYVQDPALVRITARHNHEYACDHFMASSVAQSIWDDLRELLKEKNCKK
ncbi:MAG: glycosyltransferase family 4 protein [Muribaculaceae bacterium]|nr:glycosyltransferase family 4 protein [Muribaculaceae bacterium]